MKKTNKGIELEFTDEEIEALDIALPLLEEISDILDESDGVIFDKVTGTAILDYSNVSDMDLLKQALLGKSTVTIMPED